MLPAHPDRRLSRVSIYTQTLPLNTQTPLIPGELPPNESEREEAGVIQSDYFGPLLFIAYFPLVSDKKTACLATATN